MIRVSTLESFRLVCASDYFQADELMAYIRAGQTSEPNARMAAGTAWHNALEGKRWEKYNFDPSSIDWAQDYTGPGLLEQEARKTMLGVTVKGTCDHLRGLCLQDHKAKFDTPSPSPYESSLQWRFYLWLFDCQKFTYNLWHFSGDPAETTELKLRDVLSFSFWRYAALEKDCESWLRRFLDWADAKGLMGYLGGQKLAA